MTSDPGNFGAGVLQASPSVLGCSREANMAQANASQQILRSYCPKSAAFTGVLSGSVWASFQASYFQSASPFCFRPCRFSLCFKDFVHLGVRVIATDGFSLSVTFFGKCIESKCFQHVYGSSSYLPCLGESSDPFGCSKYGEL